MEEPEPAPATEDSDLKRSFGKAYTTFQTQATSLVGLARQFKELQARWGSTEDHLRSRFREVRAREEQIGVKEKEAELSKSNLLSLKSLIKKSVDELDLLSVRIREKKETCEVTENRVSEAKAEMEAVEKQVGSSKCQLRSLKCELDALKEKVREKKEECELIENRGLELRERLEIVERGAEEKAKEAAAKEVELRDVEGRIEVKERGLGGISEMIEERRRECGLVEEEIEAKRRYMEEWEKEMQVKKGELVDQVEAMKILLREKGKECELIEDRLLESLKRECYYGRCVEERRKEFEAREKVLKEVEGRIRVKERDLDGILKSIQERTRECDLKGKQVMALERRIEKCEKEMELKRQEWSCKVEMKERELEGLFEKFEMRGKQFEPIVEELRVIDERVDECLNEGLFKERYLQSCEKKIQERERALESVSHELEMKKRHIEEGAKQLELNQVQFCSQEKTQQLEREKYLASLKSLLEQQEKSMDALQLSTEGVKRLLERQLEQQGGVIVLKQNEFDSQQLEREVLLVLLGKSVEECQNQFIQFQNLVREQKKHLDSLLALHIRERPLENKGKELNLNSKHFDAEVNTELWENITATDRRIITQSVCDRPEINTDGRSFEVIPGIIRNLIKRKQLKKAITFICNFKQSEQFPLVPLLAEYVEDAKKCCAETLSKDISHDEKEKVVDDQIADLKALVQCIEDHSLEWHYPPMDIMMEIQGLGQLKENPNLVLSLPSNVETQEQRKGRKRRSSSTTPTSHTYQLRKRG